MTSIDITTTVPLEVLLAAGYQLADLNNIFITDSRPNVTAIRHSLDMLARRQSRAVALVAPSTFLPA